MYSEKQISPAEVTDERLLEIGREWTKEVGWYEFEVNDFIGCARAILALRPLVPMTDREIELIDGMIAVQLDHAQRCDAISNSAMSEKQKGWDMERVELLRRFRAYGITTKTKKETP